MTDFCYRFADFMLYPRERQLTRGNEAVELNARYLDALTLLVSEQGKLISKEQFLETVWAGTPVTDEALTQCIKVLRKNLGDSAASSRFIETVPKHGYRFIAPVELGDAISSAVESKQAPFPEPTQSTYSWQEFFALGRAGTIGGAIAGIIGGLLFGFAAASQSLGAISMLLVLVCVTIVVASVGAAGVAFGISAGGFMPGPTKLWRIAGGAIGGMTVGAFVKLLGLDAFQLLLGRTPGDITGAIEGTLLGGAVGLGFYFASIGAASRKLKHKVLVAAVSGGSAGIVIALLGGRLMGGSLDLLAHSFPDSRLRFDQIGVLFGENGFGPISQVVTTGLEGALFATCIVAAMVTANRRLDVKGSALN